MTKLKSFAHKFAHGLCHFETPFHLTYLGAGAKYYLEHDIMLAGAAAGLFIVVLAAWIGGVAND